MRPFRETIPIDEAPAHRGRGRPAARPQGERRAGRSQRKGACRRHRRRSRCAPVRTARRWTVTPWWRPTRPGASRETPARVRCIATVHTGEVANRAVRGGECIQIATGAPASRRRRRRGDGGADRPTRRHGRHLHARAAPPAHRPAGRRHRGGPNGAPRRRRPYPEPRRLDSRPRHPGGGGSTTGRGSASSPPATRSSSRGNRSLPGRSTTSTVSPSARSSPSTAASPPPIQSPGIPSRRSAPRSTRSLDRERTSSSSRAAARSASAT